MSEGLISFTKFLNSFVPRLIQVDCLLESLMPSVNTQLSLIVILVCCYFMEREPNIYTVYSNVVVVQRRPMHAQ